MLCIFLVGTLIRAYAFGSVPPGLQQDEASAGYDAWSLLHYGIDRNGFHNPVTFVAWGSGMFALGAYLSMPFIALVGLNAFAVRLPFLLAGVASILLFADLVKQIHGIRTARAATFLVAICPWHIVISRWALDSNLLPLVFLAATAMAVRALEIPWFLPASFALFGLSLYAYGTAYIAMPVYLALVVPYALYYRRWPTKPLVVSVVALGLVSLPAVLYVLVNTLKWDSIVTPWLSIPRLPGVPRFETVGNFRVWEPQFLHTVVRNLRWTTFLAVTQSDGQIWNSVPGYGLIYLFSMPLALFGFVLLCRQCWRREFTAAYFILAWCITAAVLSALVTTSVNRLNVGLVPLVYCTGLGLAFFQERVRAVFLGLVAVYTISFAAFGWTYFNSYRVQVARPFHQSLVEAIRSASEGTEGRICITDRIPLPYIYALFANEEDPREFLRTVKYSNPGDEFQRVSSFARYQFGLPGMDQPEIGAIVVFADEAFFSEKVFSLEMFGDFVVALRRR
jgi:4-amino-4-deoxy-L-arabinose transferase-like glycosyltransferase